MSKKPLSKAADALGPPSPFPEVVDPSFRSLLENLPIAAYTCDAQGLITFYNQRSVELWGRSPAIRDPVDRFCGSFRLFTPEGAAVRHEECWMALALRTGQSYSGQEIVIERADGTRVSALAHATPLRDAAGAIVGAVNVLVDISERQRSQQAQALLAAIVESSDDAIISKTLDGHILTWNRGAERLFGYTADEVIGRPVTLLIPPDRLTDEHEILGKIRRGERVEHYETVRVSKHGRLIDISLSVSPLRDSAGRVVGASKVARDIGVRKQADDDLLNLKNELAGQLADLRRLHEMSVRLSTTLELPPILQETLSTALAIEGTERGLLSLYDPPSNQLRIGASHGFEADLLSELDGIPSGSAACDRCLQQRQHVVIEDVETDPAFAPYRTLAQRAGFRAIHCTPLITRMGRIVGVLSTHFVQPHRPSDREMHLTDLCARQAVDFIENAQLYGQLRDEDRRKDEFLATLAHELRNPLAPISNSMNLLRLSGDLSPAAERVRDVLERQVNHLVRLVDDLLEVSRITRGKIELRKERVELSAVLANAVEISRPLIEGGQHQLALSIPPEPLALDADPVRLVQVIANLLNNAAKFMDPGGQIWLSVQRQQNDLVISVRDTGMGIPAHLLPRVFDMFAQVNHSLDRPRGGLGIGLTLARTLVEMHDGQIEARSAGPGQGAEFIVRLPLAVGTSVDLRAASGFNAAAVPLRPSRPRRIVVVDDARDSGYVLARLLQAMGQQVQVFTDGPAALEYLAQSRPDLIISDIAMPQMDGYELARRIRQQPHLAGVKLVALTGFGQSADRRRALEAGFDNHLTKPVGIEALQALLNSDESVPTVDAPGPSVSPTLQVPQ